MDLIYFFITLGASIVGAVSGIGGGVIIKPVLDVLNKLDVSAISFLSGCSVFAMTIMTLLRNRNSEIKVDKKKGTCLAIGSAVGGLIGKQIFEIIRISSSEPALVGAIQSFLLAIVTMGVLIFTLNKLKIKTYNVQGQVLSVIIGFILGTLSSFLGIGGGPINLAVLYLLFSMDTKLAAINSIYIIFFSQGTSLIYSLLVGQIPSFESEIFGLMIAGGILGGILGPSISRRLSLKGIDKVYLTIIVVIIVISTYNGIHYMGMI